MSDKKAGRPKIKCQTTLVEGYTWADIGDFRRKEFTKLKKELKYLAKIRVDHLLEIVGLKNKIKELERKL